MEELTPRQRQVLDFVTSCLDCDGYPPTLREIAAHLGIRGTLGAAKHLDALERKGLIRKSPGSSRGLALTGRGAPAVSLPVVGTVRAGSPQPAMEEIEGYFAIDPGHRQGGAFFLRVKGDSMIGAGILEGDLALVRPQPTAANGEIVIALLDGEATLKRFFREPGRIRLQPENPLLAPIIVRPGDGEIILVGKVVGLYRVME
jgi:repressor LexA